jgi:hypothetical protein
MVASDRNFRGVFLAGWSYGVLKSGSAGMYECVKDSWVVISALGSPGAKEKKAQRKGIEGMEKRPKNFL